jgi:flagellar basal body rod protein FlgC
MAIDTNISYFKEDVGKNLYRKKTYYTLVIEQEVLANDKDEADVKFSECGIDHSQINHEITETKDGVETYMVDANYSDSGDTEYVAKVVYDLSDPYAKEEGYVELDSDAEEVLKTPYTSGEGI